MELKKVRIKDVTLYEHNARINDGAVDAVAESIKQCEYIAPIVVDENMVILAGHTRIKALKKLGYDECEVIIKSGLTEEQKRKYRLLDNKTNELAEWDYDILATELDGLDFGDLELDWGGVELEKEPEELTEDEPPEIDEVEPICKRGDIWQLGEHRLMCGDSTSEEDVAALMDGEVADCIVTDPPYNVDYTGGTELKIQNDNKDNTAFEEFLTDAFKAMSENLKSGGAFYIWHANRTQREFENALNNVGLGVREQLIWVKNALVLGRSDYQWRHEPCFYGWKDGESHYFTDDRTQTTVYEDKVDIKKLKKEELQQMLETILSERQPTTIIHEDKPNKNGEHPTMKPVKLIGRLVANSTKPKQKVLDVFAGSGSTMAACEQLNRISYSMELDERYCDVIIARYEALTGRKAEKLKAGEQTNG